MRVPDLVRYRLDDPDRDEEFDHDLKAALVAALTQKQPDDQPAQHEQRQERLHARLEARMSTEQSTAPTDEQDEHHPRKSRRWWVPAAAIAATVAVAVGVTVAVQVGGDRDETTTAGEPATVQELLEQAADELAAESGDVVVPDENQWLYRQAGSVGGSEFTVEQVYDLWIPVVPVEGELPPAAGEYYPHIFTDPIEVQHIYQDLPDDTAEVLDQITELGQRWDDPPAALNQIPPEVLDEVIEEEWVPHWTSFVTIRELLYAGDPPPQVQAKLYRALAQLPGVVDAGLQDDAINDEFTDGQAQQFRVIGWDWDIENIDRPDGPEYGVEWELRERPQIVIDPDTYHYRGHRSYDEQMEDGWELRSQQIIFDTAFVDEENQLP